MAWAKVHTDILGDPKLMRGAREGLKGLALLPWLIVAAKQCDNDGKLTVGTDPMTAADLAPMIPGASEQGVSDSLDSLTRLGVLIEDDGVLQFIAWHPRQAKPSDSKDAVRERVQRFRKRQKTRQVTPRNAVVTRGCNASEKKRPTVSYAKTEVENGFVTREAKRELERPPVLAEPTPEERARAKALADEFRQMEGA